MRNVKTVLIVDDVEDIRKAVGRLLLRAGYEVCTAGDGAEALHKAKEYDRIDLVILDIKMPHMDGFQVLETLRNSGFTETPVIMLTGRASWQDQALGYTKGADFYLVKPCDPKRLLNAVNYYIGEMSPELREKLERELWRVAR